MLNKLTGTFHAEVSPRRIGIGSLVALLLTLAGCGSDAPVADSQVAVRVNKGEISVHQVQAVLQRQPRLLADQPETAAARVLDALIDQELAAQAAVEQGLEHDPNVVQAMQLARREVLARAFQDQLGAKATQPSSDEVDRYYDSRPAVFSQRRLYTVQEFVIEASAQQAASLPEIARRAKSAEEVDTLVRAAGMRNHSRRFVQAAEDVPAGVLDTLAKLERGQSMVVPQGANPRIFTVLEAQPAPVERRVATPAISAYLVSERKRQLVAPVMKALKESAQISYQGAFAKPAAAPPAAAASGAN